MRIPPHYTINQKITQHLQAFERLKTQFDLHPQQKSQEKYFRARSLLKSAVYSARIEGNTKTLAEVSPSSIKNSKEKEKIELENLYKALEFIISEDWCKAICLDDIKTIHSFVLAGLSQDAGRIRQEQTAIYSQAGIAIYLCPSPQELKQLLTRWLSYINESNDPFIPVKVALSHYAFEKIHPFLDGNGRVGRLLVHLTLKKWGYDLKGLVAFEEYLDNNRQTYYDLLNLQKSNITPFIEFFLEALEDSLKSTVQIQENQPVVNKEQSLPPRRYEILQTIRDHQQVSFDFVKRRFYAVSDRLLRYDLKKLQDAGFIIKRGVTKGCVYEPKIS